MQSVSLQQLQEKRNFAWFLLIILKQDFSRTSPTTF
jgi:hypothetical protein